MEIMTHEREIFENLCLASPNPFGVGSSKNKQTKECIILKLCKWSQTITLKSWGCEGWWRQGWPVAPQAVAASLPLTTALPFVTWSSSSAFGTRKGGVRMGGKIPPTPFTVPI